MKLKKIIALCKKSGVLQVFDDKELGRWIGNGCFAWRAELTAGMNAEEICSMFDINEKQQDKMVLSDGCVLPEWLSMKTGEELVPDAVGFTYAGRDIIVLRSGGGKFILLDASALAPWDGENPPELYLCTDNDGYAHIGAMMGMIEVGAFEPLSMEIHELVRDLLRGKVPENVNSVSNS